MIGVEIQLNCSIMLVQDCKIIYYLINSSCIVFCEKSPQSLELEVVHLIHRTKLLHGVP